DEGWEFSHWEGDLVGEENPVTVDMKSGIETTLVFVKKEFTVEVTASDGGQVNVSPNKEIYTYGEQVTFEATSDEGYVFLGWSGTLSSSEMEVTVTVEENVEILAEFSTIEDALVFSRTGGVYINGRVHSASLSLRNRLPEQFTLEKFELLNSNENTLTTAEDDHIVESGESIGYTVSFGIQPTESAFSEYIVKWHVIYKGEEYLKQVKVGSSGSESIQELDNIDENSKHFNTLRING
ncbi:MAG: hypothetical protein WEA36_11130, partial [Balneolaceae bacterium]